MQLTAAETEPRSGIWNRLDPRSKIICVFSLSVLIAVTPVPDYRKFLVYLFMVAGLGIMARVPLKRYLLRLLFPLPMLVFLGAARFMFSGMPPEQKLQVVTGLMIKTLLIFAAVAILVMTVRLNSIIKSLEKMKVPAMITTMMGFAYRYVFLFRREAGRMATAWKSRSFGRKKSWNERKMALKMVPVFIFRVLERSRRIYAAMLSRGSAETTVFYYRAAALRFTWRDGLFGGVFGGIMVLAVLI